MHRAAEILATSESTLILYSIYIYVPTAIEVESLKLVKMFSEYVSFCFKMFY